MRKMSQDVDNSSKEIEKKNQIETAEWKSTIIEINSLKRLNVRFELAEEGISKLKEVSRDYSIWGTEEPQNTWAGSVEGGNRRFKYSSWRL